LSEALKLGFHKGGGGGHSHGDDDDDESLDYQTINNVYTSFILTPGYTDIQYDTNYPIVN